MAEYLVESGYMQMESNYEIPLTDLPTAYTTAVVNGKRKIIRNYGDVGPSKLWALQQAIDGVLIKADWDGDPTARGSSALRLSWPRSSFSLTLWTAHTTKQRNWP